MVVGLDLFQFVVACMGNAILVVYLKSQMSLSAESSYRYLLLAFRTPDVRKIQ
jgi:hypothetical protein